MIVIDVKTVTASWHNIIGMVIVLVTFVHPFTVFFWPDTDSKYYKRFYLGHFVVGSLLHLFSSESLLSW